MGIANFYKQFKEIFPDAISCGCKQYDVICFDMNQWVHSVYDFEKDTTGCKATNLAYKAFHMIDTHVRLYRSSTIVVVMDGTCPYPKLLLQKQRRKNSSLQRLQISVGTSFMTTFADALLNVLRKELTFLHLFFSSSLQKGEGEHKIARIINHFKLRNVLVVCIDADFIMLCIAQHLTTVHILRKCKYYCEIVDMDVVFANLPCSNQDFFVNICLLGNDYLPKLSSKIAFDILCEPSTDFPSFLCKGNIFDQESQNYLDNLYWTILYYKDININIFPKNQCPKVSLKSVQRHSYRDVSFDPIPLVFTSFEFHILFTIPNWHFLPSTIQPYFREFDDFVDEDEIEFYLYFWSEMLTFPGSSVEKFSKKIK